MLSTWIKIDASRNCFRFYDISLGCDLFDDYVVSSEWGRIGAKRPHRKAEPFNSLDDAMTHVKGLEAKRLKHHYQASSERLLSS